MLLAILSLVIGIVHFYRNMDGVRATERSLKSQYLSLAGFFLSATIAMVISFPSTVPIAPVFLIGMALLLSIAYLFNNVINKVVNRFLDKINKDEF
jgi:hypothetical protein